jgi:tetratricopeptide (TPR) repeat protein
MENLKEKIQLAVDIFKSGDLPKVEELCLELIKDNPQIVFLYNLLGLTYAGQQKFDEAIKFYERGIKVDPNFAMIYNNLGLIYFNKKSSKNIKKAENLYFKSIELDKNIAEPYNNLGTLYSSLSEYEKAESFFKKSISVNSKFAFAYYNLGTLLITTGNFSNAKKNLEQAIKLNPNFLLAHRAISRITKYNEKDQHLLQLKKLYKSQIVKNDLSKIDLCFALGKAHEDIKSYDASFKFYDEANLIYRKNINYNIENDRKIFSQVKKKFDNEIFKKFKESGFNNKSPIFIIGMPRSGTTLVEQILSSHEKVFGADEVETIPYLISKYCSDKDKLIFENINNFEKDKFITIGKDYVNKMMEFSKNSERTTDKLPVNFLSIGLIKLILPEAKIINCKRNPKDNIFSIYKNNFTSNKVSYAYNLFETVDYYNLYIDIMEYWSSLLPNFIYNIKYENLISDTKNEIEKLLEFCKLDWSDNCLNFYENRRPIKTASDTQVRNKIYKTSIESWKNYEKHLKKYFKKLKH